jgi:hypothetical protein
MGSGDTELNIGIKGVPELAKPGKGVVPSPNIGERLTKLASPGEGAGRWSLLAVIAFLGSSRFNSSSSSS